MTPSDGSGALAAGLNLATTLAQTTRELSSARTLLTWGTALVATTVLLGLVASGTITINPAAAQAGAATGTPAPSAELSSPPPSAGPEDSPDIP